MIDVAGVHRGVQYAGRYEIEGDETSWQATFQHGDGRFQREGRIIHGWMVQTDVHNRVQLAMQLYIERLLLSEPFADPHNEVKSLDA